MTDLSPVVIGIGEPLRGDDGVGPRVVQALRGRLPAGVRAVERVAELTSLLEVWSGARLAVVVDGVRGAGSPGSVLRWTDEQLLQAPSGRSTSSHGLSLGDALALAEQLGQRPERLVAYLVEVRDTEAGDRLSPAVERAVEQVAARVAEELRSSTDPPRGF